MGVTMRCDRAGCGRLLTDSDRDGVCRRCRRHELRAIEVGDELRAVPERTLYGALATLPTQALVELHRAMRGAHTPSARGLRVIR